MINKDFAKLIDICLMEVCEAGIQPGKITEWTINRRAKTRWGMCTRKRNGTCTIQIAAQLLEDERVSEQACKEVIIHEILHTCKECKGHTGYWKLYAEKMNYLYGYHIMRTTSCEELGVDPAPVKQRAVKYVYRCKYCGQTITKTRKCKFTKYHHLYGCGICGRPRAFVKL